jgi:thymidylate synthase (FAD)
MKTKLITATENPEKIIAYCARVSSSNQDNPNTTGLLRYCLKHGHWSPFEHASVTIEIETSRAIARQILRHRSFCFQEFSQRYSTHIDFEDVQPRRQAQSNRQSSINDLNPTTVRRFREAKEQVERYCSDAYEAAIMGGVARECARFLLPENTISKLYMTGSIRSWIHYIDLRIKEDTQAEHREIAEECKDILIAHMPVLKEILWQA